MSDRLDGATRLIPLLGDPIAQVKAPAGLTAEFARRGHNMMVVPFHVTPDHFSSVVASLGPIRNVDGFIATVLHKFAAHDQCSTLSPRAKCLGVVNVVRRNGDGGWHGDMLDGLGFVRGIEVAGCRLPGRRALLVGAGGAGSAIALALLDGGVAQLAVHDQDGAKRKALIARLDNVHAGKALVGSTNPLGFDIIVNATPMGMREGDPVPVEVDTLSPSTFVGDVITMPEVTPLLAAARERGCGTQTGVGMFESSIELMADFFLSR
jgi:shikimate dehydrogenase